MIFMRIGEDATCLKIVCQKKEKHSDVSQPRIIKKQTNNLCSQ